jgi:hypothetical protein
MGCDWIYDHFCLNRILLIWTFENVIPECLGYDLSKLFW